MPDAKKVYRDPARHQQHTGSVVDSVEGFDVISCEVCGFKHVVPLLSDAELAQLYEKDFYATEKPDYIKHAKADREWWNLTYQNYYQIFERLTPGRRLLDIGSGPGFFLKAGQERHWEVLGFEPSPDAAEFSRSLGLEVVTDFFTAQTAKKYGSFDVVHLSLVLEHVPDPAGLLEEAKSLLKPNGILCVFSPNDYNPFQAVLRQDLGFKPWWVVPTHHLNYFDFASIKTLIEKVGLKVEDTLGTFPMEFFLLSGDNYVGHNALGRRCHARRKRFETNLYHHQPELLNSIYRSLAQQSIGREFIIFARNQ